VLTLIYQKSRGNSKRHKNIVDKKVLTLILFFVNKTNKFKKERRNIK